jgi:DNA mismatch repair protein MutL
MPISALPAETVRLLGSPVVYTSPVSFVKELVDNAIDAQATSIEVFISPNTIDCIEVRDNGHGIDPEDFKTIGHRGHTSKLRKFQDLQTVGPVTLGFRGDALASAAVMSTLVITTRAVGQPTAARLHISDKGGVKMIERVAGPVGTAVKATHLFANLPVRKQWALKEAAKAVSQIRQLQHTYFFARPYLRISFKILGNPKGSWSCAPGGQPSVREAALQIFGADLVAQCFERTMSFASSEEDEAAAAKVTPTSQGQGNYTIEAFLPKPGADPVKVSKWAFISVDARPLSHAKGVMQTLYSAFKDRLKRNLEPTGTKLSLNNPFIALNIRCPPSSYDPNIEPLKDEVLFTNAHYLVSIFEKFLKDTYPGSVVAPESATHQKKGFHLPSPPASNSEIQTIGEWRPTACKRSEPSHPTTQEREALEVLGLPQQPLEDGRPTRIPGTEHDSHPPYHGVMTSRTLEPTVIGHIATAALAAQEDVQAHATTTSHDNAENVLGQGDDCDDRPWISQGHQVVPALDVDMHGGPGRVATAAYAQARQDLDLWTTAKLNQPHEESRPNAMEPGKAGQAIQDEAPQSNPEKNRLAFLKRMANLPVSSGGAGRQRVCEPPPVMQKRSGKLPGGAFRSPVMKETDNWAFGPRSRPKPSGTTQSQRSLTAFNHNDDEYQPQKSYQRRHSKRTKPNGDLLQTTLDFSRHSYDNRPSNNPSVTHKGDASRRGQAQAATEGRELQGVDFSAIHRRQVVAENYTMRNSQIDHTQGAMQSEPTQAPQTLIEASAREHPAVSKKNEVSRISVPPGDPRAYLMRRSRSIRATTSRKLRRLNSSVLPLETIPPGCELYNLVEVMSLQSKDFVSLGESAVGYGLHVTDICKDGLDSCITRPEFQTIQRQVKDLLGHVDASLLERLCDIEFISSDKLLGKSKAD